MSTSRLNVSDSRESELTSLLITFNEPNALSIVKGIGWSIIYNIFKVREGQLIINEGNQKRRKNVFI